MARIVETEPDSTGLVRSVKLKLDDTSLDSQMVLWWPISKIVLLIEDELAQFSNKGSHWWDFKKNWSWGKPDKMDVMKFKDNTIIL